MHRPSETVPEILAAAAFISALPHPAAVPEHLIAVLPDIDEIISPVDIALGIIAARIEEVVRPALLSDVP